MTPVEVTVLVALAALVSLIAGFAGARVQDRFRLTRSQADAKDIIARAEKEAENLRKEAELKSKDEFFKKREEFNREIEKDRHEQREQERRLEKREDTLDQKHQVLLKKERTLEHTQRKLHERRDQVEKRGQELESLLQEQTQKLHEITGLNREQAEALLLQRLEKTLSDEVAGRIQKHEEQLKATCEEKARGVLATAIQRYASEHTADTTVSTVDIPSDDMKGRIIGREGRNIRTFEKCTGVDVIVDDTPGVAI
jgi:ribonuclease Y